MRTIEDPQSSENESWRWLLSRFQSPIETKVGTSATWGLRIRKARSQPVKPPNMPYCPVVWLNEPQHGQRLWEHTQSSPPVGWNEDDKGRPDLHGPGGSKAHWDSAVTLQRSNKVIWKQVRSLWYSLSASGEWVTLVMQNATLVLRQSIFNI